MVLYLQMEKINLGSVSDQKRGIIRRDAVKMIKRRDKKRYSSILQCSCKYGQRLDWQKLYNKEGHKSLFYHKQGVKLGDRKLLNKNQEATVPKMSIDVMPDQLKLDYALWTTEAVRDLIAREFGITIGRRTVGNYINAQRFTPQKPKKRAYEQCSKKV